MKDLSPKIKQIFNPYVTVDTFANLPPAADNTDQIQLVTTATGVWGVNRKTSGLYLCDGVNWNKVSSFLTAFNDANFTIYDNVDTSKLLGFVLDAIGTGLKRLITMPDRDIDLNDHDNMLNIEQASAVQTSTTSSAYVTLDSMTFTIVKPGIYQISFSGCSRGTNPGQLMEYGIFKNGVLETSTERALDGASGAQADDIKRTMHTQKKISLVATDVLDIRYKTAVGTFTVLSRNLNLLRTGI